MHAENNVVAPRMEPSLDALGKERCGLGWSRWVLENGFECAQSSRWDVRLSRGEDHRLDQSITSVNHNQENQ